MFERSQTLDRTDPELWAAISAENRRQEEHIEPVSYTHLTLPTNREV